MNVKARVRGLYMTYELYYIGFMSQTKMAIG